jgi:hypothetical protein
MKNTSLLYDHLSRGKMKYLSILIFLLIPTHNVIGQLSFSVATDKSTYLSSEHILVTITARNLSSTPDTLRFTTTCQAGYHIDTLDIMHHDSIILVCGDWFTERIIPGNDSIIWGDPYWLVNFTGARLGAGKHTLTAWVSYLPTGWVSDTLGILVVGLTNVGDRFRDMAMNVLENNTPNPFNPSTQIKYSLEKAGNVTLTIIDMLGREVATLVNRREEPGEHSVTWNAQNAPSGVYFYRLNAGSFVETKKMVVMK